MNRSDRIIHRVIPYHNISFHPVFLDLVWERLNAMAERFCGAGHTFQQYVDQTLGGDHRAYDLFHKHQHDYYSEGCEHHIASALFQRLLSVPSMERVLFIQSIQKYALHLDAVLNRLCGFNPVSAPRTDPAHADYTPIFDFIWAVLGGIDNQTPFSIFRTLLREMSDEHFQVCMELTLNNRRLNPPIPALVSVFYDKLSKEKAPFFAWLLSNYTEVAEDRQRYLVLRYFIAPMRHYVEDVGLDPHEYYHVDDHTMDRMHRLLQA